MQTKLDLKYDNESLFTRELRLFKPLSVVWSVCWSAVSSFELIFQLLCQSEVMVMVRGYGSDLCHSHD